MDKLMEIDGKEAAAGWKSAEVECRVNWAKAANLPPMPSELLLIAKDPLIGQALADWAQKVCELVVGLRHPALTAQQPQEAVALRYEIQRTAPERIWLVMPDDPSSETESFPEKYGEEITWCEEQVTQFDVPYVRADTAPPSGVREAVEAAPQSEQTHVRVPDSGELWSFCRKLLSQGKDIHLDHETKSYEQYSARLDAAARERGDELEAMLRATTGKESE